MGSGFLQSVARITRQSDVPQLVEVVAVRTAFERLAIEADAVGQQGEVVQRGRELAARPSTFQGEGDLSAADLIVVEIRAVRLSFAFRLGAFGFRVADA